jgi:hypothetical protein
MNRVAPLPFDSLSDDGEQCGTVAGREGGHPERSRGMVRPTPLQQVTD